MSSPFVEKVRAAQQRVGCGLCLSLDLVVANTPLPIQPYDEPMLPFARAVIEATADLVCAYAFKPAYYLAEGAAGMVALERIVRLVPREAVLVADGLFDGDCASARAFARGAFEQFLADAVTVAGCAAEEALRCLSRPDRALFVAVGDEMALERAQALGAGELGLATPLEAVRRSDQLRQAVLQAPFALLRAETCADDAIAAAAFVHPLTGLAPLVMVSHRVLYASRRADFAEVARAAALDLNRRLQRAPAP